MKFDISIDTACSKRALSLTPLGIKPLFGAYFKTRYRAMARLSYTINPSSSSCIY